MYSDKKNVLQLVALLKAHGITHIVLSPGSRNAPLIHSFASDSDFTCYSVVDERSAGFFALGVIQALNRPVAVCCTSGTAALNLGPAVAEAFYQQLPLLVITADRPPAWTGQMDGQTIPQTGLFGKLVCHAVQLPEISNPEEEWHCNRLINEAILGLDNQEKGPAHINIPLSEPLFGFSTASLPAVRVIRRTKPLTILPDEAGYRKRFRSFSRRMIIVGQLPPGNGLADVLKRLASDQNTVVLADHLANIPAGDYSRFDVVLRTASEKELQQLAPELVITLGGHVVSKRLKQFIRSAPACELWQLSPAGEVTDTFQLVTDIVQSDPETFLRSLAEVPSDEMLALPHNNSTSNDHESETFVERWKSACERTTTPHPDYSDLYAVGMLLNNMPENSSLQLANSQSVYLSQLFSVSDSVYRFCNRGTNGIEGSISTAVGYAAATKRLAFLLTGDLSFFYDMNGLWNRHLSPNLRILLNNNGGGGIFDTLPGLNQSEMLTGYITANHTTTAKGWAEQRGFTYLSASNAEELQKQLSLLLNPESDSPVILEVFTTIEKNSLEIKSYYRQQETKDYE
ncbi:MAG: 2-succinyl-5-enolpyruvyl-6-hydroxy-3-cyclohexene-1-carboxylic-acid synthase [Porphyromonadaceae bacterium]|nr:2-succinyl-5-enolpyruvyl-6-hydroxy-3-cyclohexene-1-carboxylic-acid synthase [Porphyromonadaceae bacterium]